MIDVRFVLSRWCMWQMVEHSYKLSIIAMKLNPKAPIFLRRWNY